MSTNLIFPKRRRRIRPSLDLVPMIDTVFTLLLFFAVAIMLAGPRAALPVRLPQAKSAERVLERVVVLLAQDKPILVNGEAVDLKAIGPALRKASRGNLDTQVVLAADQAVSYAQLIAVLDEVKSANFSRIALAAAPKRAAKSTANQ